jgi:uncharacterized membrane protein YciS (DUF1049 family)
MRLFVKILVILVVILVVLLREFNPGMITFNLLPSKSYEISKSTLFLISLSSGLGSFSSSICCVMLNGSSAVSVRSASRRNG